MGSTQRGEERRWARKAFSALPPSMHRDGKSPYEMLTSAKPDLSYLRAFGCAVAVWRDPRKRTDLPLPRPALVAAKTVALPSRPLSCLLAHALPALVLYLSMKM